MGEFQEKKLESFKGSKIIIEMINGLKFSGNLNSYDKFGNISLNEIENFSEYESGIFRGDSIVKFNNEIYKEKFYSGRDQKHK